jgi:signal transduction histidine kinase
MKSAASSQVPSAGHLPGSSATLPGVRLAALFLVFAATLSAAVAAEVVTHVWQSEDGLPGNVVRSLVQAADGHLWVATAEGVVRFDGIEFEPIEPDGELRRIRFAFWRLFAPEDGSVWVTTFQGGLFRIRDGRLEQIVPDAPRPRRPVVTQVVLDAGGPPHFLLGEEIWRVENGHPARVTAPDAALLERFADDLERQSAGGRAIHTGADPVPARLHARDGSVWAQDESGQLLIDGRTPVDLPGVPSPYLYNELLEDRDGNVWIATPMNGLARVRRSRVKMVPITHGPSQPAAFAVMQDRAGAWWIANRSGGIDRLTEQGNEHLELVPTGYQRPVAAIFEDRDQRLWLASRSGSVFIRDETGGFSPQFTETQTPSKVRAIAQGNDGTLWFGGEQGLASYDGTKVRTYGAEAGLPECDITVLTIADGSLIAATSDGRVFRGGAEGFRLLGDPEPLQHWWVSGLLAKARDELWAATVGGGLFLWNGTSWRQFGTGDGLPDLRLTCVLEDDRDHLWFGSLGGILRASRKQLLGRATNRNQPLHWLRLDRSDGLPTRECIGGYQPAGWKGSDGQLWFPTSGGVVRLHPGLVGENEQPPPVFLRAARVNGVERDITDGRIEAGPGRTRLEFRFAGLDYSAPEKVSYRARLDGLDDAWRELGSQRLAAYEAVPPGQYSFQVVAVNGDGVASATPLRVAVRVKAHFWKSAWFIVAMTVLTLAGTAGIGWHFARRRLKRRVEALKIRHARENERSRIARDLHDDLGARLTEISILSALAAEGGDENTLRPSLDQLSGKAKDVVATLDEIVWAVNPREDTLRSLVDYLAAFAREFLETAGIALRTEIPRLIPETPLDAAARHGVFLAAREALNNLVKHSKAGRARLAVRFGAGSLEIRIEDNGRGFSQEWEAKGYGVANLRDRMRTAGGECIIASVPGEGVSVTLTLPLLAGPTSSA